MYPQDPQSLSETFSVAALCPLTAERSSREREEAKMSMGMRVTSSPALETFKPEQIISLCRKKQGWEAGGQQAD